MGSLSRYAITRVDSNTSKTHGWIVSVQRRGEHWRKTFSDRVHGSKSAALAAAVAYRDKALVAHPPMTRAEYASIKRKNNRSGTPGLCRYETPTTERGEVKLKAYWVAGWPIKGRRGKRVKFSVEGLGEKGAYRMALAARREALERLDQPYVNSRGFKSWLETRGKQGRAASHRRDGGRWDSHAHA